MAVTNTKQNKLFVLPACIIFLIIVVIPLHVVFQSLKNKNESLKRSTCPLNDNMIPITNHRTLKAQDSTVEEMHLKKISVNEQ